MTRNLSIALACALSVATPSVFAAAQSSAAINSISFQLIDLNPFDGIATNYSFINGAGSTNIGVSAINNSVGESESYNKTRAGIFKFSQEFSTDVVDTSSTASISSSALTASGSATAPGANYSASASTGPSSYSYTGYANLSLSANSILLISADASVFASATNPQGSCLYYYCSMTDQATATASLQLNYNYSMPGGYVSYSVNDSLGLNSMATPAYTRQDYVGYELVPYYTDSEGNTYYDYRPIYQYTDVPKVEQTQSDSRMLTVAFVNTSNVAQTASLSFGVSVSGFSSSGFASSFAAAPVPEAETYALFLAGLGVVGAAALRRRQA